MKKLFQKLMCSVLVMALLLSLLPMTALALDCTGAGTATDPYVYSVATADDLSAALGEAVDGSVIKLIANIEMNRSLSLTKSVTLLGNGHEIRFTKNGDSGRISIGNEAVVNFGSPDGQDVLTLRGNGGAGKSGQDGPGFVHIGSNSTLNMYDGVTLCDFTANNYYGGGVTVYQGVFHMYGGTIENCGVRYGSNCYGGGVGVLYGSQFIMDGGRIRNCFVEGNYDSSWYYPHTSGGGVFVGIGASFIMNDGSIENCSAVIDPQVRVKDSATGGGVAVAASYESYQKNGLGYLDAAFEMNGGSITGNSADIGGGISVLGTCTVNRVIAAMKPAIEANPVPDGFRINEGTISNNTAETGGGIFLYYIRTSDGSDGTPKIDTYIRKATISGNESTADIGGGICILSKYTALQVENCTITENGALDGGGIGIYGNTDGGTTINRTTISNNQAQGSGGWGGGIAVYGNSLLSFDEYCRIFGNTAGTHEPASGGGDDLYKDDQSTIIGLPEMEGIFNGRKYGGWYWDYDEQYNSDGDTGSPTFDYPDGTTHLKKRYNVDNAVAYTPISSEVAERFLKVTEILGFNISFDKNCDEAVAGMPAAQTVESGQTAVEPSTAPTRDGYVFGGWYTDQLCTEAYDFSTPVTENITLYAKWVTQQPVLLPQLIMWMGNTVLNTDAHEAYIIGYEDDTVRPENNITRAEVATIFFRLLSDDYRASKWSTENSFCDVNAGDWYNNAVSTLANAGILGGYPDGTFRPNAPITRAEFAAIVTRFSSATAYGKASFTDVSSSHWASNAIALAEQLGWVGGYPDGTFRPDKAITRAETMTLVNRVLGRSVLEIGMLPGLVTFRDNQPGAWYYTAVQEATNSHTYMLLTSQFGGNVCESWTGILRAPDWTALEKSWSDANSK